MYTVLILEPNIPKIEIKRKAKSKYIDKNRKSKYKTYD
jgi:hypothetical protein